MDTEALKALYGRMTEKDLEAAVEAAARMTGWLVYHTYDSRRSEPGFPDLVLVKGAKVLWRECKTTRGKVTPEQQRWALALIAAGQDWAVWRPYDWGSGAVTRELEGGNRWE